MKLKKIILNNIRSFEHQEIEFLEGATLLSGDIGCGKTSILLAIEFALFGLQPGQRGFVLLRNGAETGSVNLEFEIEDKNIIIERTLKKSKTISQDYCSIRINGEKQELSVTELKNKVLHLLNYHKEFAKKQNVLYKFTVYTPQEEMKEIILQNPQIRINTLRHVFGVSKYKQLLENILIIISKLREEKRMKQGLTANFEEDKEKLLTKEEELEEKYYNLASIEKQLFLKKQQRKKIQEEKEEVSKKVEERKQLKQEIEKTKIIISNKQETFSSNLNLINNLKVQIKELQELNFDAFKISELENKILENKRKKENLNDKNVQINAQINSLVMQNEEHRKLESKISNLDICPTCLQNVDAVYRANVLNNLRNDISKNEQKIRELEDEKKEILLNSKTFDSDLSCKEKELTELKILKVKLQDINKKQTQIQDIENTNSYLEKDIKLLEQHLCSLKNSIFELEKFDNVFECKQKQVDFALEDEKNAEIKVAELKKEIDFISIQINELKQKVKKTREIREQLNYLIKLENWLSSKFASVISFIEKNVMLKLKAQFSQLFSEWFYMLVPGQFNVWLDEEFSPRIEQQDYELDYAYLSGGERTAIALAYRLSLNQVLNSFLSNIKTKGLVILDEPTDGFSGQQLDKMRDVLQELNSNQLIIVSHEQKIESFVENVIRLKKEKGISKIEESKNL